MSKLQKKYLRYLNLTKKIKNWKQFLVKKVTGFHGGFVFDVNDFGKVAVPKKMHSPFKENMIDEVYYSQLPEEVMSRFSNNPTIIDIGGNAGFFSLSSFKKFPKARIHAFEPHPYCFKVMEGYKTTFTQYDWHLYNNAVSDKNDMLTLHTTSVNDFTTMANTVGEVKMETFEVESVRLDTILEQNNITHVDFMKVDCEGAEYDILYALDSNTLQTVKAMCIECHKGSNEKRTLQALDTFIAKAGFKTKNLVESERLGYIWAWKA